MGTPRHLSKASVLPANAESPSHGESGFMEPGPWVDTVALPLPTPFDRQTTTGQVAAPGGLLPARGSGSQGPGSSTHAGPWPSSAASLWGPRLVFLSPE